LASEGSILCASAAALALGSYALYSTFEPTSSFWGKVTWRARDRSRPWVSLTFDDGPTEGCTDRILDVLQELDVRATFFVIGKNVAQCPELLRRMDAQGHLVANHTFDHGHFDLFRGWSYWRKQVQRTNELIEQIIGKKPAIFRPPMGFTTQPIHHAVKCAGQAVVTWSRRARDGLRTEIADILMRTAETARHGDILMLHDGIDPNIRNAKRQDRDNTIASVRPLVERLRRRELETVRLDQLLGITGYVEVPAG
jgi:peptidoglycan/xylan/chitin deacetylase (PgdA/CDA1 family)